MLNTAPAQPVTFARERLAAALIDTGCTAQLIVGRGGSGGYDGGGRRGGGGRGEGGGGDSWFWAAQCASHFILADARVVRSSAYEHGYS